MFGDLPHGRPPDIGVDHRIELDISTYPIKVYPYKHPKIFKYETERTIKELLDFGFIIPSSSPFSSYVVLVKKKYGTMCMCIDYRDFNKNIINN